MKRTLNFNWKKQILLFLVSQAITLFGSTLVQMAIIWYITIEISKGSWIAIFTICTYLPQFFVSFLGGIWADKYNRKYLIIGADALVATITFLMILILSKTSSESTLLKFLLLITIIRSIGAGIQIPAVNAIIPQLVPKKKLIKYNGINTTMQTFVQFAAPTTAGVIFSISSFSTTLMVDVITAILGIGFLSCLFLPSQEKIQKTISIFNGIREGFKYIFLHKYILLLFIVYGAVIFLCVPAGFLANLLVKRIYGSTYWYLTIVEVVGFMGMFIGGLLINQWKKLKNKDNILTIGLLAFGLFTIGMGITTSFTCYLILMFFYGIMLTTIQISITTLLQEQTKLNMQGRIFGLFNTIYSGFLLLGMGIFGPMADIIPLQWIMSSSGIILMLVAGIFLVFKNKIAL